MSAVRFKHVVVYQSKNFGDCLLTTPLVSVLLHYLETEGRLTIVCRSSASIIFQPLDLRIETVEKPSSIPQWMEFVRKLKGADYMFLPHASSLALGVSWLMGIKSIARSGLRAAKLIKPNFETPSLMNPYRHTAETHLDLVRRLGFLVEVHNKKLRVDGLLRVASDSSHSLKVPEHFIHIHPGSRWMFKTPQMPFWQEVLRLVHNAGYRVVLSGEPKGLEQELIAALANQPGVVSLLGQTDIPSLTLTISKAKGYLGVDTLASHIAAGLGVPGVVLFGPTSEAIWGPFGVDSKIQVHVHQAKSCRPCHADGCGGSKLSDCLNELNPKTVVDQLLRLID